MLVSVASSKQRYRLTRFDAMQAASIAPIDANQNAKNTFSRSSNSRYSKA